MSLLHLVGDQFVSVTDAAEILGCSRSYIYEHKRELPFMVELPGGAWRASLRKLTAFMGIEEANTVPAVSPTAVMSARMLAEAVEDAENAVSVWTPHGYFIAQNETCRKLTGYSDEWWGKNAPAPLVVEEDLPEVAKWVRNAVRVGGDSGERRYRIRGASRAIKWVATRLHVTARKLIIANSIEL